MKTLRVNIPGKEYNIHIGEGLLNWTGELLKEVTDTKKAVIITDSNVAPLYCDELANSLSKNNIEGKILIVEAGEESKSLEVLSSLYDEILEYGITRSDLIIALGGGVVGDLAGYCAATLLRGIPFVQIPTTLLAQVDSSVGGKVAVNLPQGKNLVGAFYQPKMVIIDPLLLRSLEPNVFADGMAEVIKYGAIKDKDLFEKLEQIKDKDELCKNIGEIIYTCCNIKREIVEDDQFDTGNRMILNFGHTFGHAIEKKYDFKKYTHGKAVAIGMIMACNWGEENGFTSNAVTNRVKNILLQYNLPISADLDRNSLLESVKVDKKGTGSKINLILIEDIGKAFIYKIEKEEI